MSANSRAPMLSTSPSNPSSSTRPSRLRRLSNLRTALQSSEPSPSRSSRPLFHRNSSNPEVNRALKASRDTATPSPGPDSSRNTLSPSSSSTGQPATATPEPGAERAVQSPTSTQSRPGNRRRSQTTSSIGSVAGTNSPTPAAAEMARSTTAEGVSSSSPVIARPTVHRKETSNLPSIRFVPASQDMRASRPSLNFQTITRVLPTPDSIIRVGRYSEKDAPVPEVSPDGPSDAAVGFKSKVVSRRHCEFFWKDASWWVKDVKSSSGTFLNHIRLSQPGQESKPWPVKDGDIVQLGIDFKGGEEAIFRCVKIRILCNRGWQKELNSFNTSAHKNLRKLATGGAVATAETTAGQSSTECTICLSSIAPCQALFIAPCSHTWHYKCIRPIIQTEYPAFLCPNCRAVADLEEDIEEVEQWEQDSADGDEDPESAGAGAGSTSAQEADATAPGEVEMDESTPSRGAQPPRQEEDSNLPTTTNDPNEALATSTANLSLNSRPSSPPSTSTSNPIPIPSRTFTPGPTEDTHSDMNHSDLEDLGLHPVRTSVDESGDVLMQLPSIRSPSGMQQALEAMGPATPRNTAGPFVFDGSAS